jgi:hypothetical protein
MLDTCCRMYVRVLVLIALLCFFHISGGQKYEKNRVKQLRLEHVHTFYNKYPTYLKGSVRPPEI